MVKSEVYEMPVSRFFPKLMRANDGEVVFFTRSGCGVVVGSVGDNPVGYYCATWNMTPFSDFNGWVKISSGE